MAVCTRSNLNCQFFRLLFPTCSVRCCLR
uniref:Uncharacterized protein n=1 Tax=Anguilla anguilla TaxID=7936 RepID=A0A0E9TGT3_ANGAN